MKRLNTWSKVERPSFGRSHHPRSHEYRSMAFHGLNNFFSTWVCPT